ncbi:site-specific integrase [Anabaena cylindrica FACHB-243]|uniref:Integrase family protein n=1 Tax=Anabaena cylindrica (strain ATCC 27899 / PCC 7122) TaxID=272123 RepID=K9ZG75_ANACC|nr:MULTISPECIES: site-specific integrase [Anabaena]AFZ57592.1 integrase family protein [Anabaena cylindrica PCC 7122]MBD2418437.1 site-specific integrase [Anabaena cylindrica FACHB-243]MBY5285726.1 site-specific integrase [Anabaena sp. CCAP 1446/1C]MBY5310521.1 site-specific integrase [Anabaena sp. CCAP 1446/1C]MCM2410218.1 site-specific integrase [Anabaena sp. CCAP 1446/1C]
MEISDQGIFDGFTPPASTDGSYLGIQRQMAATQQHLDKKFQKALADAKARLKAGKVKVGLVVAKDSIQLQASLPTKPGDIDRNGTGYKQYKISLGIPASLDGVKTAEEEAQELGKLIARKQFEWTDKYLGKLTRVKDGVKTVGEVLETFETEYFKTHKSTEKSQHTFSYYLGYLKRYVGLELLLNQDSVDLVIANLQNEYAKQNAIKTLKVLKNTLNLTTFSLDNIKIKKPQPQSRDIPSDEDVVKFFQHFYNYSVSRKGTIKRSCLESWKMWQWVYGMLATYGLRPRELFVSPNIDWWLSPENKDNTWKVHPDTKTGYREALPLHPDWVQLFDLKNPEFLKLLNSQVDGKTSFIDINTIRVNCSSWFRRVNIPFTPYDLRHAWAIRAHIMGVPIKAAADNLGHSVEIHTEVYQKWFSLENRKKVIGMAVDRQDDIDALREENARLRAEVELLKQALARKQVIEVLG